MFCLRNLLESFLIRPDSGRFPAEFRPKSGNKNKNKSIMDIHSFTKIHFGLTPLSSPLDKFPEYRGFAYTVWKILTFSRSVWIHAEIHLSICASKWQTDMCKMSVLTFANVDFWNVYHGFCEIYARNVYQGFGDFGTFPYFHKDLPIKDIPIGSIGSPHCTDENVTSKQLRIAPWRRRASRPWRKEA